jgi:hypothetical protein
MSTLLKVITGIKRHTQKHPRLVCKVRKITSHGFAFDFSGEDLRKSFNAEDNVCSVVLRKENT